MSVPSAPVSPERDPLPSATVSPRPAAALRVLLADDDIVNQRLACLLLEKLGHLPVCVANGQQALAQLAANPFDVAVLDVEMPGLGGPETAARIRSGTSGALNPAIPILGLSGHGEGPERNRCLAAGMNGYLTKPLDIQEFKRALEAFAPGA